MKRWLDADFRRGFGRSVVGVERGRQRIINVSRATPMQLVRSQAATGTAAAAAAADAVSTLCTGPRAMHEMRPSIGRPHRYYGHGKRVECVV